MTKKLKNISENSFEGGTAGTAGMVNYGQSYGTFGSPEVSQNPAQFPSSNKNKDDKNKSLGNTSNTAKDVPKSGQIQQDVNAIYSKKKTPSPDSVVAGLKYEMGQQIKKDKAMAKQVVLDNLKKNPEYYSGMHMLNVSDIDLVSEQKNKLLDAIRQTKLEFDTQVYIKLQELKKFKVTDYIGLRLMREQLSSSLNRLKSEGKIEFDGTTAALKSVNESKHPNDAAARTKITPNIDATKQIFAEMSKGREKKYVVNSQICDVMKEMWAAKTARSAWKSNPKTP